MGFLNGQWTGTTTGISGTIGWHIGKYPPQTLTLWEEFCQAVVQEYWNQQMSTITICSPAWAPYHSATTGSNAIMWTTTSPSSYTKIYNISGYTATFTSNLVGTYYDEE